MAQFIFTEGSIEQLGDKIPAGSLQAEFYDSSFSAGGSFGLRVGRGGKRAFFLIYRLNGKRVRMPLGTYPVVTLPQARERAILALREVERGRDPQAESAAYRSPLTFEDLANRYLSGPAMKLKSRGEYERIIRRELIPAWGRVSPRQITDREVTLLVDEIAEHRNTPILAERVRAVLSAVFSYAVTLRVVERNPVFSTPQPIKRERVYRILTLTEIQHLIRHLSEDPSPASVVIRLVLYTGQLPATLLRLQTKDLSGGDHLTVFPDLSLPLPFPVARVIHRVDRRGSPFLIPNRIGGPIESVRREVLQISRAFKILPRFTIRDLRRAFQIRMQELGVRPDVVDRIQHRQQQRVNHQLRHSGYNYAADIQAALQLWAERITPETPKRSNLIELFPKRPK